MIAQELLSTTLPVVTDAVPLERAYHWMEELNLRQLPVALQGQYAGMVLLDDLLEREFSDRETQLAELLRYPKVCVGEQSHLLELLRLAAEDNLEVVPVVDAQGGYVGGIIVRELLPLLGRMMGAGGFSAILELRVEAMHYSLAEISRLVEVNSAKVLSAWVLPEDDARMWRVVLRLNSHEQLPYVLATFERFNYQVLYHSGEHPVIDQSRERLSMLLRYLEM